MTLRALAGSSAIALLMTSSAGLADVTPEQVWQGWQDATAAMGNKVSAESATREGDTLVVSNISIGGGAKDQPTVTIGKMSFTDKGDGTVAVVLPDSYPLTISVPPTEVDAKPTTIKLDVAMPGASIIASGTPEAINYKTDAPEVSIKLGSIDGTDAQKVNATGEIRLTGLAGTYVTEPGDLQTLTEDFSLKALNAAVSGSDQASNSEFTLTANLADIVAKAAIKSPKGSDMADLQGALAKGATMDVGFTYGATSFDVNATDAGKPTQISGSLGGGSLAMAMDAARLDYSTDSKTVALKIASPDIPIPDAAVNWGQAAFHLLMPVSKSDTPADFALMLNLTDLSVADGIWAMIDPTGGLKHDPATLVIDTKGKVTLTKDLLTDATGLENAEPPGQLNAFDLTALTLRALGAELTGAGSFTFDNSDTATFGGVPAPTGKIDLKATGVNALIDTLVKMGFVPEDQAMQGRMMLSMFANTSTTADEMTSTLEFKDKHFFANGQQLQ